MRSTATALLVAGFVAMSVTPAPAADHTIVMTGDYAGAMFFDPPSLTVRPGDRVRWFNEMIVIHTATSGTECTPDGQWTSGQIAPGGTSPFLVFNTEGSFPYYCRFHCEIGMVGHLEVSQVVRTQPSTWGKIKALYRPARP